MKISRMLTQTLKEDPQEAEIPSHKLMLRSGMIRRVASGIFNYLPLGLKVIRKVEKIIREEMNDIGGQELLMPALTPMELWEQTGRREVVGDNLFQLKDRWGRRLCLGMTHEETVTDIARKELHSYKDLPIMLYQIQMKFRDEPRPRGGVLRGREFIMKDAYSFHRNDESLDETYRDCYKAYQRIFARCGMETVAVIADPGPIGGTDNHEFMVLSESGEDTVFLCDGCGYAANKEMAAFIDEERNIPERPSKSGLEKIHTPNVSTIEQLMEFMGTPENEFIKALVYIVDKKPVMALVRGDAEVNEVKLRRTLEVKSIRMATADEIMEFTGGELGFSGPVGMEGKIVLADPEIKFMSGAVCGANEKDYHFKNVNPDIDFKVTRYVQLREARLGDRCPLCGKMMRVARSIELGHIFKLGTKYSESMKARFNEENGSEKEFIMGCYGIGVTRIVAAAIEAHYDRDGVIWPVSIAPFECVVMPIMSNDKGQMKIAGEIYLELKKRGIDVALDDRDARPGFKFKDADLIGYPLRIVVGKKALQEGLIELKLRIQKDRRMIEKEKVVEEVINILNTEKAKIRLQADRFEVCPC